MTKATRFLVEALSLSTRIENDSIELTHERDDGGAEALAVALFEKVLRGHRQHGVLRFYQLLDGVRKRRQVLASELERVHGCFVS